MARRATRRSEIESATGPGKRLVLGAAGLVWCWVSAVSYARGPRRPGGRAVRGHHSGTGGHLRRRSATAGRTPTADMDPRHPRRRDAAAVPAGLPRHLAHRPPEAVRPHLLLRVCVVPGVADAALQTRRRRPVVGHGFADGRRRGEPGAVVGGACAPGGRVRSAVRIGVRRLPHGGCRPARVGRAHRVPAGGRRSGGEMAHRLDRAATAARLRFRGHRRLVAAGETPTMSPPSTPGTCSGSMRSRWRPRIRRCRSSRGVRAVGAPGVEPAG